MSGLKSGSVFHSVKLSDEAVSADKAVKTFPFAVRTLVKKSTP